MFVASRVESGDEGRAIAGLLPQIIGYVEKVVGCGTVSRASGSAVQVKVDAPVYQGDVIETGSDGRIGIRFIDGTLFQISGSTRAVLNEFVCDAAGITNSALFEVTTGTFAFVAGDVAKGGCLRVDTPFGTIRGRAHAGGIGMLSLIALSFAAMQESQAADPNVTFLDDGSITYKQLEHGSFELVTKEAVPRHILVEDPAQTIVLRSIGSSVSVNQVANSTSRMGELQDAQQEVLANLTKGFGPPTGSSTPPSGDTLPLQPINFFQNENAPLEQEALPPMPTIVNAVFETIVASPPPPPPPPPPVPPTLNGVAGPTEIDTVAFDQFTATSGTFSASSSNSGATLTFGISGADSGNSGAGATSSGATSSGAGASNTALRAASFDAAALDVSASAVPASNVPAPDLSGFDVSRKGAYGTLYLNSSTGAYTFVPDSAAINALIAPTTESFVITVSDGTLTASQTFTITINGTNDAAHIFGAMAGSAIEPDGYGMPTATGTLHATDVDNPPDTFTVVSSPAASDLGYGTFTMTADGIWTYTINGANAAVQALNVGGTLTDTFTVTTQDGTPQKVTVSIEGTNDAAVITGTTSGSVIEPGDSGCEMPTVTGSLTATDVDNPSASFTAVCAPAESDSGYGTFTMTADGVWTYKLDSDNCAVQALNVGCTLTDTFTVATEDGTQQLVTITIEGTNDAAIIHHDNFDWLAAGAHEKSDPAFAFGTPQGDAISGASDHAQPVDASPDDFSVVPDQPGGTVHIPVPNDLLV